MEPNNQKNQAALIWNIADILRGGWHHYEYQNVVLPLVVLKRLDSILADSKSKVLEKYNQYRGRVDVDPILKKETGIGFYNVSRTTLSSLPRHRKKLLQILRTISMDIAKTFEIFLRSSTLTNN